MVNNLVSNRQVVYKKILPNYGRNVFVVDVLNLFILIVAYFNIYLGRKRYKIFIIIAIFKKQYLKK